MQLTPAQRRAIQRAAGAWRQGKPHTAWEILATAGMSEQWSTFQRRALHWARRRYEGRMGL